MVVDEDYEDAILYSAIKVIEAYLPDSGRSAFARGARFHYQGKHMANPANVAKAVCRWIGTETRGLFLGAGANLRAWKWAMLAALAIEAAAVAILMHFDVRLLAAIRVRDNLDAAVWGKFLSIMGRTEHVTLFLFLTLLALGLARRSRKLKKAALALVLAVAVAGLSANAMHLAFGRARPFTNEGGVLHGFTVKSRNNSFPSAHTCEAFTDATLLAVLWPPVAVPAYGYACAMGWARMQDNQHYPADVLGGAFWGVFCTLPLAVALRRMREEG
jgi:membrane-associated phospholipid phosphatase